MDDDEIGLCYSSVNSFNDISSNDLRASSLALECWNLRKNVHLNTNEIVLLTKEITHQKNLVRNLKKDLHICFGEKHSKDLEIKSLIEKLHSLEYISKQQLKDKNTFRFETKRNKVLINELQLKITSLQNLNLILIDRQ
jgi:hypothetical protein